MANWDESLNTRRISSQLDNYEAARTSFFVFSVDLDQLDNLLLPTYTQEAENATPGDYYNPATAFENLKLNVIKCPVPHFSVETGEYRRGNDVVKFATTPKWDGGTITVDDVVGLDTKSLLMSWLYLAYNPHTRKGGRMRDYKKNCTLVEYTQDYEQIRVWHLEGCFIKGLKEDDFDKENDGKRQIQAEFEFDRAIMELPDNE